jgi:chromosome segregation ATPase
MTPANPDALAEALADLVSAFEVSELDGTVDIAPGRHLGATLMNAQGVLDNTRIGPLADEIDRLRSRVKFLETEWSEATDRHEAAVREQHHLEEKLDTQRRACRAAEARAAQLQAEVEAKDRVLKDERARRKAAIQSVREKAAALCDEAAAYFDRTAGHYDRTQAAGGYRATASKIRLLTPDCTALAARAATAREGQADG